MSNTASKYHAFAFFDESGKLADSEIVAFGGLVGLMSEVAKFGGGWNERLRQDGLDQISMKDAINWKEQFSSWSNTPERRDTLLYDLASLRAASNAKRTSLFMPPCSATEHLRFMP